MKSKIIAFGLVFALASFVRADTPPVKNVYQLTAPGGNGLIVSSSGRPTLLTTNQSGYIATWNGTAVTFSAPAAGGVSSVGLALPASVFDVSGSPVTSTGTLTAAFDQQAANACFAGPVGGGPGTPAFRSLVAADIPSLAASKITSGQGSLTTSTTGVSVSGTNAGLAAMTVDVQTASGSQPGLLSAADWTTFNSKGSGTVTAVSVASANGFAGNSSGGVTPALTLSTSITGILKGNGTAISAASAPDFPTLNQNTTGSAALNVLKAGDTMTGPLVMPSGIPSATVINGGTAGSGLTFPSSSTVAVNTSGAEIARFGASGIAVGTSTNTDNSKLTIKNTGADTQTALQLVSNATAKVGLAVVGAIFDMSDGAVPFFGYDITNTLMTLGYNAGAPRFRLSMDANSASTNPTGIVTGGTSVLPPMMVFRQINSTAGNYGGIANTGSSNIVNGWLAFYNDTQTSSSEDSHIGIATAAGGTRSEKMKIGNKGQIEYGGTTPGVSSCGTSPSVVGNDNVGRVTVGTGGVATSCTLTFAKTWANAPICTVNDESTILLVRAAATTTAVVFDASVAFTASDKLTYQCFGYF